MMKGRDDFSYMTAAGGDGYKRLGIKVDKIDQGLSFGTCNAYDKYGKECYLFINLIKWGISIGWLTFERKEEQL